MPKKVTLEQSAQLIAVFQEKLKKRLLLVLSQEWLKDSTKYVYKDRGDLQDSSQIHSDFKNGIIRWRTPYARKRFYLGGQPGDGNRQARARWSDVSKAENLLKYKRIQKKLVNQVKSEVYGL